MPHLTSQASGASTSPHFSDTPLRILVTGATGFIGQQLVRTLLADGHAVAALSRNKTRASRLLGPQVQCVAALGDLPQQQVFDLVVNLAGARILGQRWTTARQAVLLRSRVDVTRDIGEWMAGLAQPPRILVSASAVGYYGAPARGDDRRLDEQAAPQPIFMSQLCQQWEAATHAAAQQVSDQRTQAFCMRFGMVLGNGGALPLLMLPIKLGLGGRLGDGQQWLPWIHVDDVVAGMAHVCRRALKRPPGRLASAGAAYNFTAPETVTQAEFSRIAAKVLHRPCFLPTPAWPVRLALGDQADIVLEGQRAVPARLLAEGFAFKYTTLENALRSLYAR